MGKTVKSFETALKRLEEIVETLESGELSLEESIRIFEEGVGLTRSCSRQLEAAEQKVSSLLAETEGAAPAEGPLFEEGQ